MLWYETVGKPFPGEDFGHFLGRVAQARVGTPYAETSPATARETLTIDLDRFECVSFLESSLAVARCAWRGELTQGCFVWELMGLRYRSGLMGDYASRLHYFVDWLADNEGRWRLEDRTALLGGEPMGRDFHYMTRHGLSTEALKSPVVRREMVAVERHLTSRPFVVLPRDRLSETLLSLQDGDVIAVVGDKPGRLVTHAGFIIKRTGETPRLLHASSYRRRVVLTTESVTDYVLRRPERIGIIVARPLPPQTNP